ncbi:MAG: hypothetical protein ACKOQM_09760 [Novosphingobium sp.]
MMEICELAAIYYDSMLPLRWQLCGDADRISFDIDMPGIRELKATIATLGATNLGSIGSP